MRETAFSERHFWIDGCFILFLMLIYKTVIGGGKKVEKAVMFFIPNN